MLAWLDTWWPLLAPIVASVIAIAGVSHAVMNKRDVRSAAAWSGLILLVPAVGALLYVLLGVNRIRRTAASVRGGLRLYEHELVGKLDAAAVEARLPAGDAHLAKIALALDRTSRRPLVANNQITTLRDGDEAYPEMIRAIESATKTVALCTYIFDNDIAGRRFADALGAARERGVEVRVLIDDAGARYSFPPIVRLLRARDVRVARFLRVWAPWSAAYANMRNHRKILVVDGSIGFTGGMNIREDCLLAESPRHPTRDLHARIEGPLVTQLMDVFAEDWTFATGEVLEGERWFPAPAESTGDMIARVISDGPDEDLDCLRWTLHAALSSARRSIRIITPYFLPDEPLITALNIAALRGVTVDIVLPERGNLRLVNWAMRGELWKVLDHGCRVWLTPAPFDHSKVLTVDGAWSLIGSANWDPRSLRLNFELGVESYDRTLAATLDAIVDSRIAEARRLDAETLAARPLPVRLRDSAARLLAPYL